jgi:hypothetical protein
VSVYPQVQLSVSLKPRVVYTSPVVLYDGDPNIALGTSEPETPTLSFSITSLPSIDGDSVAVRRYAAIVVVNPYASGGGGVAYVKFKNGAKELQASVDVSAGSYWSCYAVMVGIDTGKPIDIYAWATVGGFYLRNTAVVLIAVPIVSLGVASVLAVKVDSLVIPNMITYSSLTANDILLSHSDVPEVSLTGAGSAVIRNNIVKPSVVSTEKAGRGPGGGSIAHNLVVLYPSIIAWAE